jgi:hypothetical protein
MVCRLPRMINIYKLRITCNDCITYLLMTLSYILVTFLSPPLLLVGNVTNKNNNAYHEYKQGFRPVH